MKLNGFRGKKDFKIFGQFLVKTATVSKQAYSASLQSPMSDDLPWRPCLQFRPYVLNYTINAVMLGCYEKFMKTKKSPYRMIQFTLTFESYFFFDYLHIRIIYQITMNLTYVLNCYPPKSCFRILILV